jgi:hypothetical protein
MDNRGVSHSFGARRVARVFVMPDEGMFISRCGKMKKAGELARAGLIGSSRLRQCDDVPLV